ncbi:MAG: hypothetical protein Q8O01_00135 [Candidatus Omnitrophota bacterium]|nr:hypothetical protein [Candidatus Omnitrophota bacterium]
MTGSELYKKKVLRYLDARDFYVEKDSSIEGIFADLILKKKNDDKEYWLETKAAVIDINDKDFLVEMGKYLNDYLLNLDKVKFILAVRGFKDSKQANLLFNKSDEEYLKEYVQKIIAVSNKEIINVISNASLKNIKKFFKGSDVLLGTEQDFQNALEKIHTPIPIKPNIIEAEYSSELLKRYNKSSLIKTEDPLFSNLIKLNIPETIFCADSKYRTVRAMFESYPGIRFPDFRLLNGKIYSFYSIEKNSELKLIAINDNILEENIKEWDKDIDNTNIILYLLYKWINEILYKKGLKKDERTDSYYFVKENIDTSPKTIYWVTPNNRKVPRDVIIPMKNDEGVNFWTHRAVNIGIRKLWDSYYIQIDPRWLFSSNGFLLYDGEKIDRLDRFYRKSNFNRNYNQYYDFLFWKTYLFPENIMIIDKYIKQENNPQIYPKEILSVINKVKPNISEKNIEEETPTIPLNEFFSENIGDDDENG